MFQHENAIFISNIITNVSIVENGLGKRIGWLVINRLLPNVVLTNVVPTVYYDYLRA